MAFSNGAFTEIAPRVWRAVCDPEAVNVVLVAGEERAMIIDTGASDAQGRALREAAEAVLDVPLTHALVTHGHHDHWWGLGAFADLHTLGHESLADEVDAARARAAREGVGASIPVPTELVSIVTVVELGNRFLEVVHPFDAHTRGDLFVTIGDADLIIAGDLVESAGPPSVDADSDLEGWVRSLDLLQGSMRRTGSVLPGHGDARDGDWVRWQRQILNGILTQTRELMEKGVGADRALAAATWPWPERDAMQAAIDAGYRHWQRKGLVARPQLGLNAAPRLS